VSVTQGKIEWARQQEQEYGCQSRKAVLIESKGKDGIKSEAVRQAGQRALQRLTSLFKAVLSYITSLKRQKA
jgi:hypothetical protein